MDRKTFHERVGVLMHAKRLPEAVYIHRSQLPGLPWDLRLFLENLAARLELAEDFNVLKFGTTAFAISFLKYPGFYQDPHPVLAESVRVNLATGKAVRTNYRDRANPPILHRKEAFLDPSDPHYNVFTELTRSEEEAGLYKETQTIGFKLNWERLLATKGLAHRNHRLVRRDRDESLPASRLPKKTVHRHKTALARTEFSKPVKLILEFGLFRKDMSFFDYGCGLGADLRGLRAMGHGGSGWDPVYAPEAEKVESDIVNLGYVLNVIEDPAERIEVLAEAWRLTRRTLVVSTVIAGQENYDFVRDFGDGVLTRRNTFQKHFDPGEIQSLIEDALGNEAIPLALGIYAVFRDPATQQEFVSSRSRRTIDWEQLSHRLGFARPKGRTARMERLYAENRELLDAFWGRLIDLGRIPGPAEFEQLDAVAKACGSAKQAFNLFIERFGRETLDEARARRCDDLLVYLAIAQFRKRVPFKHLSDHLRADIKTFFGDYRIAEAKARDILFAAGDPGEIFLACEDMPLGWQEDDALFIHRSLLDELPPILRVYVRCGALLYGDPSQADLIKIHMRSRKLTFLHYDDFEGKALPELKTRIKVNLRTRWVQVFDHSAEGQLLYFKERVLAADHPRLPEMQAFSAKLRNLRIPENGISGPSESELTRLLELRGLKKNLSKKRANPTP